MPRKPKVQTLGGGRVPVPTYMDKENQTAKFQTWLADYTTRVAAKNALAKARRKDEGG